MAKTTAKAPARTMVARSRALGAEQKALYHQVTGAGTSRVTRKFLGLTEPEQAQIRERLIVGLEQQLRRKGYA